MGKNVKMGKTKMNSIKAYIAAILAAITFICAVGSCDEDTIGSSKPDPIFVAIPTDAAMILVTGDIVKTVQKLKSENNIIWNDLKRIRQIAEADKIITCINDIINKDEGLRGSIRNRKFAISFHNNGHKTNAVAAILIDKKGAGSVAQSVDRICKEYKYTRKDGEYDKTKFYKLIPQENGKKETIYFSYNSKRNIMVFSFSEILIQNAIRQINSGKNLNDEKPLNQIITLKGNDADANLIINYPKLYTIIDSELNAVKKSATNRFAEFAQWSVLDLNVEDNSIICAGYSCIKDKAGAYVNIFNKQEPVSNNFVEYIPDKTIIYSSIGISDMTEFQNSYKTYLEQNGKKGQYDSQNNTNKKKYNINLDETIYKIFANRITEFTTDYSIAVRANDNYIITETKDKDLAEKTLRHIVEQYRKNTDKKDTDLSLTISSQANNKYTVYFFPIKNLFATYFGDMFGSMDYSYYTFFDNKIIFAQNSNAIREYVNAMELGKTLERNSYYKEFNNVVTPESNIFYYIDLAFNKSQIAELLNERNKNEYNNNYSKLKNFRSGAFQISHTGNRLYTNAVIKYYDKIESERLIKWKTPLDSNAIIKPQIVKNFENGENTIIVQDETNKLYFINKNGKTLWKKQLPEPIVGQVYEIDYYHNGKIQYLCATKSHLYCIDKNGNFVENYPIEIKEGISSEISLYDYENDGNYRIFVPCNNKKLYLYTKEGKPLDTWNPFETKEKIITPVYYLKNNETEYLVFADNLKTYILNRRGEPRIVPTKNFPKAPNTKYYLDNSGGEYNIKFITTNSAGDIEYINFDGSPGTKTIKNYSINHNFVYEDINNDGKNEYIFTDDNILEIFNSRFEKIGNFVSDGKISGKPIIFRFGGNNTKIGIVCKESRKAYLLNNDASLRQGFPIEGITDFSITRFDNSGTFNLIIGGNDNYLYNYTIQ